MIKSANVLVLLIFVLAIPAFGQEVKVVVSEGVGSDPQSAAQNAAQNALTQVVGSFIDADTQLKKRTEVQNGIRSEAKQINRSIREYSQGSISSFEVLETNQDGQLFRVSAKVGVRLAEFKAYVNSLAEGETRVGLGLFASMETSRKNTDSLASILADKLIATLDGSALDFEVGSPIPYRDFKKRNGQALGPTGEFARLEAWVKQFDTDRIIVVPLKTKFRLDFLDNLTSTLNQVSQRKKRVNFAVADNDPNGLGYADWFYRYHSICGFEGRAHETDNVCWLLQDSARTATAYQFAAVSDELANIQKGRSLFKRTTSPWFDIFIKAGGGYNLTDLRFPDVQVSLLGKNDEELQVEILEGESDFYGNRNGSAQYLDPAYKSYVGFPTLLWSGVATGSQTGGPVLIREKQGFLVLAISDAALRGTVKIAVRMIK